MKTYPNILKPVKQYILIGIIVMITLFGLTLKANAQSTLLKNDVEKISKAVVVQMQDYDFDVVIPKISTEELKTLENAVFNQLVYVTDGAPGYYSYKGSKWELQKVTKVFELIDLKLSFQAPKNETLIIMASEDSKALLDYNHHVNRIYEDFGFDPEVNALAINEEMK